MKRPVLIGALAAAVIALVASAAVAVGTLGGLSSGPSMARDHGQSASQGMMGSTAGSMMGSTAGSMMGSTAGSMMGSTAGSMMGSTGAMGMAWLPGDGVAVTSIPSARARAAKAAASAGLHPGEVLWFDNGFYVELKDSAGQPATEVIVDPRSGAVSTEPGPAMMWNTRFGMRASGDGGAGPVDSRKARQIATSWLATNRGGTTVGNVDAYPGYFTLDLQRNGSVSGMMSVSSTGTVWYHTWHGAFIAMKDS